MKNTKYISAVSGNDGAVESKITNNYNVLFAVDKRVGMRGVAYFKIANNQNRHVSCK